MAPIEGSQGRGRGTRKPVGQFVENLHQRTSPEEPQPAVQVRNPSTPEHTDATTVESFHQASHQAKPSIIHRTYSHDLVGIASMTKHPKKVGCLVGAIAVDPRDPLTHRLSRPNVTGASASHTFRISDRSDRTRQCRHRFRCPIGAPIIDHNQLDRDCSHLRSGQQFVHNLPNGMPLVIHRDNNR